MATGRRSFSRMLMKCGHVESQASSVEDLLQVGVFLTRESLLHGLTQDLQAARLRKN